MILILTPNTRTDSAEYRQLSNHLATLQGVQVRVHSEHGSEQTLTELYLIGNTKALDEGDMQALPCVERVVRVSQEYRVLGRHKDDTRPAYFDYNGVRFGQDTLHVFAGLCAVDNASMSRSCCVRCVTTARSAPAWVPTSRAPARTRFRGTARLVCPTCSIWRASTASR